MSELAQALGARLKAERERRGASAQKMADDMHLDAWVIDALESGDYQRIGPSVYAKGHLKKYASILGVSTAEPGLEAKAPPPSAALPPLPIIRLDPPPALSKATWAKLAGLAAVVLVAAAVLWWRPWHARPAVASAAPSASNASTASAGAPQTPIPSQDASASPPTGSTAASSPSEASNAAPRSVAADASPQAPAAVPTAAVPAVLSKPASAGGADLTPGVGRARLRLSFSADSRVDVYDYSGRRVFTGNGRANSVKTIAGIAPFRIYLGFASGVQLQVNDRAVRIGPQFLSGDVARFEAGADGVLRRDSHSPSTDGARPSAAMPRG
jgi:cytoskeleton protein RodZ